MTAKLTRAFLFNCVARFGVLRLLTSDREAQFTSALREHMSATLGLKSVVTTAYQPQPNSMFERIHRRLKEALKTHNLDISWFDGLPWVLLGLRTTVG